MGAVVVALPERNIQDIPRALHQLADDIAAGKLGNVQTVAWVMAIDGRPVELGLIGAAAEVQPTAHMLFAKAMRALEIE